MFDELYSKGYIDRHMNIKEENREALQEEYPDLAQGLYSGKVKNLNKQTSKPIKIKNAVYQEMRELWEKINERYILQYDSDLDDDLAEGSSPNHLGKEVYLPKWR